MTNFCFNGFINHYDNLLSFNVFLCFICFSYIILNIIITSINFKLLVTIFLQSPCLTAGKEILIDESSIYSKNAFLKSTILLQDHIWWPIEFQETMKPIEQGFFQAFFLPPVNGVKKLKLNWVLKTQFIIRIFFLYCNLFDREKTYTQVKISANKLCNS